MKFFIVLSALVVAASANTLLLRDSRFVPIRSMVHNIRGSGLYDHRHESTDAIVSESGSLVLPSGSLEHGSAKVGEFSYMSPEGIPISLSYTADEHGFRPTGSHLPVPPPMPEEIRAMLPTLPKLVEVEDRHFVHSAPLLVHSSPSFVRAVHTPTLVRSHIASPVLLQEAAPERMLVSTNEFHIDSSPTNTHVRIGN